MKPSKGLRRRRKGENALLTAKLDKASRTLCKERAGWQCEVCATGEYGVFNANVLHAHHIIRSTRFALRFEPRNLVCLCWSHHFSDTPAPAAAHGDALQSARFRTWLRVHRAHDYAYVLQHAEDDGKMTVPQKRDLLAQIGTDLQEFQAAA